MIIKQLVDVDGPKKVPMVKQIVVDLIKALDISQLASSPFAVLEIRRYRRKGKVKIGSSLSIPQQLIYKKLETRERNQTFLTHFRRGDEVIQSIIKIDWCCYFTQIIDVWFWFTVMFQITLFTIVVMLEDFPTLK